jgi:hypothetical protein
MFDRLADSIPAGRDEEGRGPARYNCRTARVIEIAHVGHTGTDEDRERWLQIGIWLRRNDDDLYRAWFETGSGGAVAEEFIDLNGAPSRDFLSEDYGYDVVVTHNLWGFPNESEIGGSGPAACSIHHGIERWRKRLQGSGARYIFLFGTDFNAGDLGLTLAGYDCYFVSSACFMTALVSRDLSGKLAAPEEDISFRDMASARLQRLPELLQNRSLDLSYAGVTGVQLVLLKGMAHLEDLRLVGTRITDDDLALIGQCPSIRKLNLDGNSISGTGVAHLRELRELEALSLNESKIECDSLKHLEHFTRLQWLSLVGTGIGDDGLHYLASIKCLRTLILVGTRVTTEGVERLRRALPQCAIDFRQ